MDNLDEFFKADEPEVEAEAPETPEVAEAPEAPEAAASTQPRGPDGKFIPKGETQPEAPAQSAPPAPEEPQFDHAATIGERRRRQEAEARAAELEQRLAQLEQRFQPQQQPQTAPDMFEDPEGYTRYVAAQAAETARSEAYQQFQTQRIEMSAAQFAPTVPDYADKVQAFQQMVQVNPALLQELYRSPNPAEYAYNTAKTHLEIQQYGGIEGLIKARVEDALKAQAPAPVEATPTPPIPDTLADAQSSRGSSADTNHVPSLDDIVGKAFR